MATGTMDMTGAPTKPSTDGKSQQQIKDDQVAYDKQYADWKRSAHPEVDKYTIGGSNMDDVQTKHDDQDAVAAQVGGSQDGAQQETNFFLNGMKSNDREQLANRGAMASSLANMTGNRGTVSPENQALVGREAQARLQQGQALDLSRQAAMGGAPSAQAYQTQMDANNAMGGQAGAMGAARGLAGLGGVQAMGNQGLGMLGSQNALAGGMGRSKEMYDNMAGYGGAAGNMVQGDLGRQVQNDKNSLANAGLNDAWTEGNANLLGAQGKLGLAQGTSDDAWYDRSSDPQKRQMSYDARINALRAGANADNADLVGAKNRADDDRTRGLIGGGVSTGLTLGGTALGGPAGGAAGGYMGGLANSEINKR